MASDAFFPMPDTVEEAAKAGITAIIQPGEALRISFPLMNATNMVLRWSSLEPDISNTNR